MIDASDPFAQWMSIDLCDDEPSLPPVDEDVYGLKDFLFPSEPQTNLESGLLFGPDIPFHHLGPDASHTILQPPNSAQTVSLPTSSSPSFTTTQLPALSPDTSPLSVVSSPWLRTPATDPVLFDIVGHTPTEAPWHTKNSEESIIFIDERGNTLEDPSQIRDVRLEDIACTPQVIPCRSPVEFSVQIPPASAYHQTVLPVGKMRCPSFPPSSPSISESQPLSGMLSPYSQETYGCSLSPSLSPLTTLSFFSSPNGSPFVNCSLISPALSSMPLFEDQQGDSEVVASVPSTSTEPSSIRYGGKRDASTVEEYAPTSKRTRRANNMDEEEWRPQAESERIRRRRIISPSPPEMMSSVFSTRPSDEGLDLETSQQSDATHTICQLCGKGFTRMSDYIRHKENSASHPETRKVWPCPYCDKTLGRKDALGRHIKTLHSDPEGVPGSLVQEGRGGAFVERTGLGQRKTPARKQPKKGMRKNH